MINGFYKKRYWIGIYRLSNVEEVLAVAYNINDLAEQLGKSYTQMQSIITHAILERESRMIFNHKACQIVLIDIFEEDRGKSIGKFLENWKGQECFQSNTRFILRGSNYQSRGEYFMLNCHKKKIIKEVLFWNGTLEIWTA